MQINLDYSSIKDAPLEAKRKSIAKQVAFELAKYGLIVDALGKNAAAATGQLWDPETNAKRKVSLSLEQASEALRRKYATPDQNPVLTTPATAMQHWFHSNMPELDLGWLPLFDLVDLRGRGQDRFEIDTTSLGVTWEQRLPGEKTSIRRVVSEAQVVCALVEYTAGIGILDRWIEYNNFWKIDEVVSEFIANGADNRASVHYGLFTAQSTGIDVNFATDDTTTFNTAAATILRAVRSSGYAVGSNAQFDILCSPEKVGRILAMLDAKRGSPIVAFGTQDQPIAFNVRNVISTTYVTAADTGYYLILPGRKNKRGLWKDVTLESGRDVAASATDWVGVEQFNAAVADTAQVRRVKYS